MTRSLWLAALAALAFFLYLLELVVPTPSPSSPAVPPNGQPPAARLVEQTRRGLAVLAASSYGDFDPAAGRWLDLAGFRADARGDAGGGSWAATLPVARRLATAQLRAALGGGPPVGRLPSTAAGAPFANVTGYVRGPWRAVVGVGDGGEARSASMGFPRGSRVTGKTGDLHVSMVENGAADFWDGLSVRGVSASLTLRQDVPEQSWQASLYGLHILETGSMVLATSSQKFHAMFALSHFGLSEAHFLAYQHRLNRTLNDLFKHDPAGQNGSASAQGDALYAENSDCEIVFYLQQHIEDRLSSKGGKNLRAIGDLENELHFPKGRPGTLPPMEMAGTIFSPDCGFVLSTTDEEASMELPLVGYSRQAYLNKARNHLSILGGIALLGLFLTLRQMKEMNTPSAISRVSFWTIALIAVTDHLIGTALLCLGTFADSLFTVALPIAFVQFLNVLWFSQDFLAAIWAAQEGEAARSRRAVDVPARRPQSPEGHGRYHLPIITMAGADTLPIPVTAGHGPLSIAPQTNPDGNTTRSDGDGVSFPGKLIFAGFLLFILTLFPFTWSKHNRQRYYDTLTFIFLSMWCPQILRNTLRNCRKALLWTYTLGQSALRLALMLYVYAYPPNAVFADASRAKAALFAGWVAAQLAVLAAQEALGPRAAVPAAWLPPTHDYHPILREDDEETRVILGSAAAADPADARSSSRARRVFDCAICMHAVEVPVVPVSSSAGDGGLAGAFLWRRRYMVTPCRHVFHAKCLEAAMKYRLQCPICREGLPPL